jgi:putative endonuclease
MYFVYVLLSLKDGNFYTGYTSNLKLRIEKHNLGKVVATRTRRPLKLIYFEVCLNRKDAMRREIYLKSAWGKRYIRSRVAEYLRSKPQ